MQELRGPHHQVQPLRLLHRDVLLMGAGEEAGRKKELGANSVEGAPGGMDSNPPSQAPCAGHFLQTIAVRGLRPGSLCVN